MAWDFKLNASRDIVPGYASGTDEILQRLATRLQREFGEWFLDDSCGIPWYYGGDGLLGSHDTEIMDIIVQNTTKQTEGITRILKFNPAWTATTRNYRYFMLLELDNGEQITATFSEEGLVWQK
jgi:hypothetical protein